MKHHPNPSQNAPSSRASSAPPAQHDTNSNPLGSVIDLPSFLPRASSTSGNSTAGDSGLRSPAADFSSAPGMALTQEQDSEPLDIPSFLRRARPAHDGMKPEVREAVISKANRNIKETACAR